MTRTSLHALLLSFIVFATLASNAALPQDRPFFVTIKNASSGSEQCLAFDGNGTATFPSRISWGPGPYCGFPTVDALLANKQAVWRLLPLGNDLYTVSNNSSEGERCLIFGGEGAETHPSRFAWSAGEYCGIPGRKPGLLMNKQAVFRIADLGGDQYMMTNSSARAERCLIFNDRGRDKHPSRFNWGSGPYCGFPGGKDPFLANKQGVWKIEQVGQTDILDQLFSHVYKLDRPGDYLGKSYSLTTDNALPAGFLSQTPNVWGKEASAVQDGAGNHVAQDVYKVIVSAQEHLDIMTLAPYPTGDFETAVRNGIEELARSGRAVKVRILGGWPPFGPGTDQFNYLRQLIKNIKNTPNNRVEIYVGANRGYSAQVWNHAKIVAADGTKMHIGGQNLWESDYLRKNPVHDLSMTIDGPSTVLGHRFADEVWTGEVCRYADPTWKSAYWKAGMRDVGFGCLRTASFRTRSGAGSVRVLTVGRFGLGPLVNESSEQAMQAAFDNTTGPLRLSQQDLGYTALAWDPIISQIARAVLRNRDVYIVLSNDGAKGGTGTPYQNMPMSATAAQIFRVARGEAGNMPIGELKNKLCSKLRLAPLRFGPSKQWPSGFTFANHAKFWMAGDSLFYIGSHNLYPAALVRGGAGLQELGVIVNNTTHADEVRASYWDPLWTWSKVDAVSGAEASSCIFRGMVD